MKTITAILLATGLVLSPDPLHAQTALVGGFNNDLAPVQPAVPDSIVQITAEMQGLQVVAYGDLPPYGTYWEVMPGGGMAPLPAPLFDPSLPIYAMTDTIFLVDASNGQLAVNPRQTAMMAMSATSATTAAVQTEATAVANLIDQVQTASASPALQSMGMASSLSGPPGFGINGGSYTPNGLANSFSPPNYGTNLWIAQSSVAGGYLASTGSNTIADVQYEIQSRTNLMQSDWQSEGFICGDELTNWTPLSVAQNGRTNLFLRLKSWADDGSGLPIWWQLEYFGYVGVDPNANPKGDGWSNIQKFQSGMNPNVFYTPPAPQGVRVSYNGGNNTATVNWLPSPGPVTSYTVISTYYPPYGTGGTTQTQTYTTSTNSLTDNALLGAPNPWEQANYPTTFKVQANYDGGNSAWSSEVPLESSSFSGAIVAGPQGNPVLLVSGLPADTAAIRLTELSVDALDWLNTNYYATNIDIAISSFNNGSCSLPNWTQTNNGFGYYWIGRTIGTNGEYGAGVYLGNNQFTTPKDNYQTSWLVPPFYDGRVQLKQNLIFQLRVAAMDAPFHFLIPSTNVNDGGTFGGYVGQYTYPTNYAYAGLYPFSNPSQGSYFEWSGAMDPFLPFEENCLFRNFVFSLADVDESGALTTGVSPYNTYSSPLLSRPMTYQCQTNWTSFPALLATNNTRWLYYDQASDFDDAFGVGLLNLQYDGNDYIFSMTNGYRNWFGLKYTSVNLAYELLDYNYNALGLATNVIAAGNSLVLTDWGYFQNQLNGYLETEPPKFQAVEYDFWQPTIWSAQSQTWAYPLPGAPDFSPTNIPPLLFTGVGTSLTVAGYAKLEVTNSLYTGVYAYLGQYFDTAYEMTNGTVTTKPTGVLSPYGQFFATEPGPAALLTMPDVDPPYQQGTCTVYVVSLQLDKNHDGTMDLSFNGPDATSINSPFVFWANNNFDRNTLDADDQVFYDDDVQVRGDYFTPNTPVPDYNFKDGAGNRSISCERDLQDFARLWVCGITTNLLAQLPAGSTVTLSWGDVGNPNSANPTIDLFPAADADGGIGYLTNSITAAIQTDNSLMCPYIGRLGPGQSIQLNASQFANSWAGNHFIWCGVSNGTGGLTLTIVDGSGNTLAQTTAYIQIMDIKQMYERWTVGDQPSIEPLTNAMLATEDLPVGASAFCYSQTSDTNTPYILYVHGWNMVRWEKDRFAESAFKRLYWQGYQGRFGGFRWPTESGFKGISTLATTPSEKDNYDRSEYTAWKSAKGLRNKLNDINAKYPGHVYMLAHSMGNVVAGEALRLSSSRVVNTYVASQAAVPAHTYDTNIASYSFSYSPWSTTAATPNIYGNWFLGNNGGGAGQMINFYNTNDFALQRSVWQLNQLFKPDAVVSEQDATWTYTYTGATNDPPPWNNFLKAKSFGIAHVNFDIVNVLTNRYEVMALAAQSYSTALGATHGVQHMADSIYLGQVWPPDLAHPTHPFDEHFYHSAQFRGDYWQQQGYWAELLGADAFNLK